MTDAARIPPAFIEGQKIVYEVGGVHPKTRDGRCFLVLDKDVYARVLRPMHVRPGPGVPPATLDSREAAGPCDTHKPDKDKLKKGSHTFFVGLMKGNARLDVTMAKGPDVRR